MPPLNRYSYIRASGRAENCEDESTYWSVLEKIHTEHRSAGGNWDRPNMLLHNGSIVIASGLTDVAWKYCQDKYEAMAKAQREAKERHMPEWLAVFEAEKN